MQLQERLLELQVLGWCLQAWCVPLHCVAIHAGCSMSRIKQASLLSTQPWPPRPTQCFGNCLLWHTVLWRTGLPPCWVCCFFCAAGPGSPCGANQFVDYDGYCAACGDGTAGGDPKDRTKCLCKSGWGYFNHYADASCTKLSRRLCFYLWPSVWQCCCQLAGAGAAGRHGALGKLA